MALGAGGGHGLGGGSDEGGAYWRREEAQALLEAGRVKHEHDRGGVRPEHVKTNPSVSRDEDQAAGLGRVRGTRLTTPQTLPAEARSRKRACRRPVVCAVRTPTAVGVSASCDS
jgi:hypothetical protein